MLMWLKDKVNNVGSCLEAPHKDIWEVNVLLKTKKNAIICGIWNIAVTVYKQPFFSSFGRVWKLLAGLVHLS